jgi:hypothetical protein
VKMLKMFTTSKREKKMSEKSFLIQSVEQWKSCLLPWSRC